MDEPLASSTGSRDALDLQLLSRVANHDRDAFRELYIAYHRRLSRFLMRLTKRYELTEEIINDTLWVVWQHAGSFRHESRVSTWIMGIAYRRMLKALRHIQPPGVHLVALDEAQQLSNDEPAIAEQHQWILHGLAQLPLEQRLVLEFAYDLGHSCEEIAAIMDCPVNTVKTRLFHARRKLRQILPELAGAARHD